MVLAHYPLWTPYDLGMSQMGSQQEIYDILTLLREFEVTAHLSGHTHRWAKTDLDGVQLITLGALREVSGDHSCLLLTVDGDRLEFERVEVTDPLGQQEREV